MVDADGGGNGGGAGVCSTPAHADCMEVTTVAI
jgi:hypothetical protein